MMASLRYSILALALGGIMLGASEPPRAEPKVLLLMDYHKAPPSNLQEYAMSEKLDGVRAIWNGKQLITRSGRAIQAPACFTKDFPPFMLDGELWVGRGAFEKALSLVQKDCRSCSCSKDKELESSWAEAGYYVFDVPMCGALESTPSKQSSQASKTDPHCTLFERLKVLESYLASKEASTLKMRLHIIKHEPITSQKQLFKQLHTLSEQGAEGLVLRKISAPYEPTRSLNALKLKAYSDAECKVVAHNAGKGKYTSKLGSLTCEQETTAANGVKSITRFKIGSGFSDKDRESPPPLGSIITYKFYGTTKNGFPRFATFHRIYQSP